MRDVEDLASIAIDCGIRIHKDLGPGLFESVYETVLAASLRRQGLNFGGETIREGLKRVVYNHHPSAPSRLRVTNRPPTKQAS
ncbi:GxxExxY protein [Sphingomonas sp. LY54]|uniref:GxxExxY protein n=1 Tax=Sphingomonas sp. LY54 TaxID=3095343 RepID=UPI002D779017|nr:GxxExxY protein [Sphingomonas sp. LY54]WRP28164.1 GxxExxY protein [Sphingomonas sp. LY54]